MKRFLVPLLSVLVGVLAFVMSHRMITNKLIALEQRRAQLESMYQRKWIVVVRNDLAAGTVLEREDLQRYYALAEGVGPDNVIPGDALHILGKKTLYRLDSGEPLRWSYVDVPRRPTGGLASMIARPEPEEPSLRAVSISVGGADSVSGLVRPNDHVDVLGTFDFPRSDGSGEMESVTLTMLQDVTVLATGQQLANQRAPRRRGSGGYNTVTLEVTPREAELLVFAEQTRGRLTLSLRHPDDVNYEKALENVDFNHIETKLPEYNRIRQMEIRGKRDL